MESFWDVVLLECPFCRKLYALMCNAVLLLRNSHFRLDQVHDLVSKYPKAELNYVGLVPGPNEDARIVTWRQSGVSGSLSWCIEIALHNWTSGISEIICTPLFKSVGKKNEKDLRSVLRRHHGKRRTSSRSHPSGLD